MSTSKYQDVLEYINQYWTRAAFSATTKPVGDTRNLVMQIGRVDLPYAAIAPNHTYFAGTQFYWDSYFTILGLVRSGQGALARGMVDNLCYLYQKFGLVPARNSRTSRGRTQPPFLTRMAWEVYEETVVVDETWTQSVLQVAADEYAKVWHGPGRFVAHTGLSRYRPKYAAHKLTVYESGWDRSTRFAGHAANLLPVDLNAQLYQYEADLLDWAKRYQTDQISLWQERLGKRRTLITQYLWDEKNGFFYDYDLRTQTYAPLKTLAGFFPLWCGAATEAQAAACVKHLEDFEQEFGLAATAKILWQGRQWDYPNGWAPLQYIVIHGLRRYGYNDHAARLSQKWLDLNQTVFQKTGTLWEKYDVVNGDIGRPGRYPTLPGFSWTNAIFLRLEQDLREL